MFDFFGNKKEVQKSFEKVRQDTDALSQWVKFLYEENQKLDQRVAVQQKLIDAQQLALREMKVTLQHMPKTGHEVKQLVDSYYDFKPLLARIKHIENKLEVLELKQKDVKPQVIVHREPEPRIVHHIEPPRTSSAMKEKLVKRLVRNSKDYIKNLVRGLVHKYGRISALQLREIVVDEQGLCSKSSFYRILDEMESDNSIAEVSDGKTKVFVAPSA
ncbi:hypothetical protein KY329_01120 [Candidatus Woesearchaeota archaeon]|nr:hypothetical protein [Candidatus Woesearchaeota archaeon]